MSRRTAFLVWLCLLSLFPLFSSAALAQTAPVVELVDAAGQPAAFYLESSRVRVRVTISSGPSGAVPVNIQSTLTGDLEAVWAEPTAPGVYEGSITMRTGWGPQSGNDYLETDQDPGPPHHFDTVTATYSEPGGNVTDSVGLIGSLTTFVDAYGRDAAAYAAGATVYVQIEDQNRNTPRVFDQVYVQLTSSSTGDSEVLQILEVTKDSGIFAGSIALQNSPSATAGDGRLQAQAGETIAAQHTDVMGYVASGDQAQIASASLDFISMNGNPTAEVLESGRARVRLFSLSDNQNPGMADSVTIEMRSLQSGDVEPVTLTETGPDTAVFEGSIVLSNAPASPDGQLNTHNSGPPDYTPDTARASYGPVVANATVNGARIVFLDVFGRETTSYAAGETVRVRVIDHNRNDPQMLDTFQVELVAPETSSSRVVQVTETGFDTGVFEGSQATSFGPGVPNALGVVPGGTVQAWHYQYNSPNRLMKSASVGSNALRFVDAAGQPAAVYLESSRAYLRLFSFVANSNFTAPDSVQVLVTSELTADSEQVTLTETGPNTSVFTGSIALRFLSSPQPNNGYLENDKFQGPPLEADTLHASYADPYGMSTAQAGLTGSRTWFADAAGTPVSVYPVGGTAYVRVEDQNRNTPVVFDQVHVHVVSPGTGDDEMLVLLETSKDSGIFAAALPLVTSGSASPGDNRLHVTPGSLITAEHIDVMGYTSSTAEALIDFASLEFVDADGEPTVELLENGTARVRLFSAPANVNPGVAESVYVELRSLQSGDIEPVTLTETDLDTGIFEGSIELSNSPAGPDGQLQTRNSGPPEYRPETVRATYSYFSSVTATATVSGARIVFLDAFGRETTSYAAGEAVRVRLIDHNRNDPQMLDSVEVELTSPETGSSRLVLVAETGFDTGVFEGSRATALGTVTPGALGVIPGGTVQAWHYQYNSPNRLMKSVSIRGNALLFVDAAGQPAAVYLESSRAYLRLFSARANSNPTNPDWVQVLVTSELTGDSEQVTLLETGPDTSVFTGSIALRFLSSPQPNNGYLENDKFQGPPLEADTLHASYSDPDGTATAQASLIGSRTWFADAAGNPVSVYPMGGTAYVRVEDQNRNTPGVFDAVHVHVVSPGTGDDEMLVLLEVSKDSGIFAASLPLVTSGSASPGDNRLHVMPGSLINAEHVDVMGFTTSTAQALVEYASLEFIEADGEPTAELLENGTARVRLFSTQDNHNQAQAESVTVELRSLQAGDVEPVTLTETGPDTGTFEGSIELDNTLAGPDGELATRNSGPPEYRPETVRATYGYGGGITATATVSGARIVFLDSFGRETTSYAAGEAVRVRLIDHNRNDPQTQDGVEIELISPETGSSRLVVVTETGFDTGIFEGSRATSLGTGTSGTLGVIPGGTVQAWHYQYNSPNRLMKSVSIRGNALLFVDSAGQPASVYLESSRAYLRLFSARVNSNPTAPDWVQVLVTSELTGDSEQVTLLETGPDTSVFTGSIALRFLSSPQPNNGYLENDKFQGPPLEADTLHASYSDPDGTATAQASLIGSRTWFADAAGNPVSVYPMGGTAYVRVEDQNRNTPGVFDAVHVHVVSPGTGDDEMLVLLEVSKDSGIFAVSLPLVTSGSASPGDNRLHVMPGSLINAEHIDVLGYTTSTAQALIDFASLEFIEADGEPTAELLENGTARVRLFSTQDNQNQAQAESVTVELRSLQAGDIEPVTLTETGPDTGTFEGSIELANAPSGPDGQLATRYSGPPAYDPETVRATYGSSGGITATATVSGARIVFLDAFGRETTSYAAGEAVRVRLIDHNRNNPQTQDGVEVELISPETGSSRLVVVTETGFDTGIFEGSRATSLGTGTSDTLGVIPGGTVQAWHYQYSSPNRLMKTASIRGNALLFVDAAGQPAAVYLESSRAYLRLFSARVNSNPTAPDWVQVLVGSELTGDTENVTLTETGLNTSVFTGSIALRFLSSPQPNNGYLENDKRQGPPLEPDTLHASYNDPDGIATAQASLIGSRTWFADAAGNPVSVYPAGGTAYIRVEDQNRNTPGVFDQVHVHVVSPGTGDDEMLVLLEVSKDSGIFAVSLPLVTSGSASPGDNRLHVMPGYLINAEHIDVMGFTTSTAQALIDFASLEFIEADGEPTAELLENGTARVRLFSTQDNQNQAQAESVTVELRSLQAGDIEPVTLTETGPDTGTFEGSIELAAFAFSGPDGQLATRNSGPPAYGPETVRATYGFGGVMATATVSGARITFLDAFGRETSSYAAGEAVRVRLIDHNRNNPQTQDGVEVELISPETGSSRLVVVTETGFDTGVFEGSRATSLGSGTSDTLGVIPGGTVQAWHYQYNSPNRLMKSASIRGNALVFVDAAGQPAAVYLESSRAYLRLFSARANSNPTSPDSVQVLVGSELTGDTENVTLIETGPNTSVFTGSVALRFGYSPQSNNGYLENDKRQGPPLEPDTLHASYSDPDGLATAQASLIGSRTWFADAAGNPVSVYPVGGTAYVRVEDQNRNTPGVFDQVHVHVVSPGTGDDEMLVLLEVSKDSGIFAASLPLVTSGSASPGDNRLHVMPGLIITAEHVDVMGFTTSTAQALIDFASLEFVEADGEPTVELLENGTARLRLFSTQDNSNPVIAESVTVELRALQAGDVEPVTLTETGSNTSVFEGSIELASGPTDPNFQLETRNSGPPAYGPETVRATYGFGGVTATATVSGARITFLDAYGRETTSYAAGEAVRVRVTDHNRNNPQTQDGIEVELISPETGSSRLVVVTETGFDTGVFEGSRATSLGSGTSDTLGVIPGGTVQAWHQQYNSPNRLMKSASIRGNALLFVDAAGQPATVYLESSRAYLRLFSARANSNPTAPDWVQVLAVSELTGDTEYVTLTETGPGTSVFEGSIALRFGYSPQPDNGYLENDKRQGPPIEPDTLHASYSDPDGMATAQASLIGSRTWFADAAGNPVSVYPVGGTAYIRVEDQNRNTPGTLDQVYVHVTSPMGDDEMVQLQETGPDAGVFAGSLPLATAGNLTPGDNQLHVMPGLLINAEHIDVMGFTSSTAQALIDYASLEFIDADGQTTHQLLESDSARVRLFSVLDNNNSGVAESATVELRSLYTGDVEPVTLTETGPGTGIFEGSIDLALGVPGLDGQLVTMGSGPPEFRPDTVRASYGLSITATATTVASRAWFLNLRGQVTTTYALGSTVRVRVEDHNWNYSPAQMETIHVQVQALGNGETEFLQLTETGVDTGIFEGSLPSAPASTGPNDGTLSAFAGEQVEVRHQNYTTPNPTLVRATFGSNLAPQLVDDTAETIQDQAVAVAVLANDTSASQLSVASVTQGTNGTVAINPDGTVTYTPAAAYTGPDSFTYLAVDAEGGEGQATVTVTVIPSNQPPQANYDQATTPEDQAVVINVLANDNDPDNDPLQVVSVGQPASGGSVAINANNTVTFTPAPDFFGDGIVFTYEIRDPDGATASSAVTVNVTPVNDAPVANDDTAETTEDEPVTIPVQANDTDIDSATFYPSSATQPAHGTVVVATNGTATYTPEPNFHGTDTFVYTLRDDAGATDTATVTVTVTPVNDPPVANVDTAILEEDSSIAVSVLANDTDADNDTLSVSAVTQGTHGSVVINPDQTVTYTPNAGFHGPDEFTYTASDGHGGTATSGVAVNVTPVNDAPVANDDAASVAEDESVTVPVLANDTDEENDTLDVTAVTQGTNGAVVINPDKTVTYTPNANFSGTDTFTYTAGDGNGTDTATVTVTVSPANDAPAANDDTATVAEDESVTIPVLANDTDPENDTPNVTAVTQGTNGAVVINPDKTVTYTPNASFSGTDTFTYTASDGNGGTDTATVTVTVSPVNDAPAASADAASVAEDGTVSIPVLANDTDADNDTLTVSAVTQGTHGSVSINPDKTVTYTPNANFNGTDSFTYTISDGNGGTATASVNVTVIPANDAPAANPDGATTPEDTAVTVSVLANDTDPDGHTLSVASVTQGVSGSVVINPNGTVTYTPSTNFSGSDSFTYTASDGNGGTATASVSITVTPVNDAPVAVNDSMNTMAEVAITISLLANDFDLDGPSLSIASATQGANGTVAVNANQTVTYTPNLGFKGNDSFTYTITDGAGGTATGTVTVTVLAPPRISTNIQVLYNFAEGSGSVVNDVSGVGTPLNLTISNPAAVSWLPGALSVNSATLLQTAGNATKVITACQSSNAITIEAWVMPDNMTQTGPAHIVALSQNTNKRNFTLGQSASRYEAILRISNNQSGTSVLFGTGTATVELTHVVFTRDSAGNARTYINGALSTSSMLTGSFSSWASFKLGVANDLSGSRPWVGDLHLVAVYSQALSSNQVRQNYLAGPN